MRETKLKRLILGIYIGAFVLLVAVVLIWKLKFYDQVNSQIAAQQGLYDAAKTKAAGLDTAQRDKVKADQKLKFAQAQLDYLRLRFRSLSFDLDPANPGAREATFGRYLNEYFTGYGLALRRQLLAAANETSVQLDTKAAVQTPPQVPENVVSPPSGFLKPLTPETLSVSVTGTLPDILRFLDRINHAEILMMVGNIKLQKGSGTAGAAATTGAATGNQITAIFPVTPYLLATGPSATVSTPAAPSAPAPALGAPGAPVAGGIPTGAPGAPGVPPAP